MKIIMIIGTLITVVIIAFATVMYLNAATAPITNMPQIDTPYGNVGGAANPQNAIDLARSVVSMDKNRQQDMQNIMDQIDGAGANQ
jgi:hypothetical protein